MYKAGISGGLASFVMGLLACVAVILMVGQVLRKSSLEVWIF